MRLTTTILATLLAALTTIAAAQTTTATAPALQVGVALPLHNNDGDGRRMVEYYRGMLLACEDLKHEGYNINICAYNTPKDCNISDVLANSQLRQCQLVFTPLYTKQLDAVEAWLGDTGARLVIPFSIGGNSVWRNPQIYQVYQTDEQYYNCVLAHFAYRYKDCHIVVVDGKDDTSDKGLFTASLRRMAADRGMSCRVTAIDSNWQQFAAAFSATQPNMIVLNTARSPELNRLTARLDTLQEANPTIDLSLFGYTEWLMYEQHAKERLFKYNAYVPTTAYYNPYSTKTRQLEERYRKAFGEEMQQWLPRFALTGYDHAMHFLRALQQYGPQNMGAQTADDAPPAVQTPLHFQRVSSSGGYQNTALLLVHYNRNKAISIIDLQ